MDDHHRPDAGIGGEHLADAVRVDAVTPVALDPHDLEAEALGHRTPEGGEVSGLEGQDAVARGERVDQRGLPRASARRRVDDHGAAGLEDRPKAAEHLEAEPREVRPAVVDRRRVDRAEDPVGDVGGPRDLQEVPPAAEAHRAQGSDAVQAYAARVLV